MTTKLTKKRNLVTSFNNLPAEMQEAVKAQYPLGFSEAMRRIDKPNGDFFYAVPFETEDTAYLVKIDVKIDDRDVEEDEKDYFDEDEIKGAEELQDDQLSEEEDM